MSTGEIVARGSAATMIDDAALLEAHLGVH
jgi:hypothetical protein